MKTQEQIKKEVAKVTVRTRHSFAGLQRMLGLGDRPVELALAIKALMDEGTLRFWGNGRTEETLYIGCGPLS